MAVTGHARELNPLERILKIVTDIRPGEGITALLMALNIFFLMASYYILKPAREAFLSLEPNGAQIASYAAAAMAILLFPIVGIYGRLAERFVRRNLIAVVTGFFISNLFLFFLMAEANMPYLGRVFFVWIGIFNNMVVAQFWAFGNDIYVPDQGKRLFPLILLGQTAGAILGPILADRVLEISGKTSPMLLLAGGLLALCILLTYVVDGRQKEAAAGDREQPAKAEESDKTLGSEGGFQLILQHRYLFYIALLILVLNLVNTTGEFILRDAVFTAAEAQGEVDQDVFTGSYYARFFLFVNIASVLIQALLVSRLLKFIGVRGALFVLPCIALAGYGAIALLPALLLITVMKTAENSVDYSLMNTLRAALYLPTTREMKYKAKQAIDTFFVRAGDVISAGVVFLGTQLLGFGARSFSAVVFVIVLFWLGLARAITKEHKKLLPEE